MVTSSTSQAKQQGINLPLLYGREKGKEGECVGVTGIMEPVSGCISLIPCLSILSLSKKSEYAGRCS